MVTNTKTNVKLNGNFNQTDDTFNIKKYKDYLKPVPKVKGKCYCPNCGKNDFSVNMITGAFNCFSGGCKPDEIVKAIKQLAGDWVEKNDNNSFTSVSNKPVLTVDSMTVKEKIKEARPANRTLHFDHQVVNSVYKVRLSVIYENHVKVKCYQKAVDDTGKEFDLKEVGINTKDVLPYFDVFGFEHLANKINPSTLMAVEGQLVSAKCFNKFGSLLPTISVYGGSNFDLDATAQHLGTITNLKKVILSPDRDKESCLKFLALGKELEKAGKEVGIYLPFPNDKIWHHLDSDLAKQYKGIDMLEDLFKNQNLTAEQFINQIEVATITLEQFERMLTGKTVTVPSVNSYAVPMDDIMFNDEIGLNWLVPGMIQEGASNMIAAYSNVGKSTLCSQLAIALTQGDNFLGHDLAGDKKILYHTSDENIVDLKERLKSQGYIAPNPNFKLFNEVDGNIWDVTKLDLLDYELTHNDHDVVIMDSLSSICASAGINENGPEIGQKLTELIKLVCVKHCKTLIIVHHANRSILTADRLTLGVVCGHNSIARPLNQVIALRENTTESGENVIDLKTVKTRSTEKTELRLVRDDESKFQISEAINSPIISTPQADNSNEKLIIDCLSQSDDWLTRDAIQGHTKLSKGFCNKILLNLTNTGKVERAKVGKGYQYKINSNFIGSKLSDIYINQEPEPEPMAETLDSNTSEILPLIGSETLEPIEEPIEEPVNNANNVQNEVTENSFTSEITEAKATEIIDTVDTEKESKPDSMTVNGTTFKVGDYYYQNKAKIYLIKIARFIKDREGVMGIGPLYEIDQTTGKPFTNNPDGEWDVCLDGDVYPYNE